MVLFAQSFDDQFRDWFSEGITSTVIYIVLVLAVVGLVMSTAGRSRR